MLKGVELSLQPLLQLLQLAYRPLKLCHAMFQLLDRRSAIFGIHLHHCSSPLFKIEPHTRLTVAHGRRET